MLSGDQSSAKTTGRSHTDFSMVPWSPTPVTGTIASFMDETLNHKKNENFDRKGGKPQCCPLLPASDTKEPTRLPATE